MATTAARASGSTRWRAATATSGPIHPQLIATVLDQIAADDAVFLADVGTPTLWAARYLRMNGRRRLIGSFNHGTMANALPQAIGVQASHPGRQVVTLSGDGGLAMLMGELLTLRQQHLPVKVVVLNNGALGFVELEMKADGIVTFGTDLDNPSFAEIAPRGRAPRRADRASERARGWPADGLRARRTGGHRGDDGSARAVDPAEDHGSSRPAASRSGRPAASSPAAETKSSRSPRPTSASCRCE